MNSSIFSVSKHILGLLDPLMALIQMREHLKKKKVSLRAYSSCKNNFPLDASVDLPLVFEASCNCMSLRRPISNQNFVRLRQISFRMAKKNPIHLRCHLAASGSVTVNSKCERVSLLTEIFGRLTKQDSESNCRVMFLPGIDGRKWF